MALNLEDKKSIVAEVSTIAASAHSAIDFLSSRFSATLALQLSFGCPPEINLPWNYLSQVNKSYQRYDSPAAALITRASPSAQEIKHSVFTGTHLRSLTSPITRLSNLRARFRTTRLQSVLIQPPNSVTSQPQDRLVWSIAMPGPMVEETAIFFR